jgi:DNA-binding transcriptional MerR regulator
VGDEIYKLEELARAAGTSARTVRYYVQRGLLPPPAFRGKDTAYGREHLVRLAAIRRLQEAYYPLDAIVALLANKSVAELEAFEVPTQRQTTAAVPSVSSSARPVPRAKGRAFERIEVVPGVELMIADDAPAASREVAERILVEMHRQREER